MPRALSWFLRRLTRYVFNPITLRRAGQADYQYAALHHVGRKSGRAYTTPIAAEPIVDGFVITLPYGDDTNWCQNVLAAGEATLDVRGETTRVINPRVVDLASIQGQVGPALVRKWRRLAIPEVLRVDRSPALSTSDRHISAIDDRPELAADRGDRWLSRESSGSWRLRSHRGQR